MQIAQCAAQLMSASRGSSRLVRLVIAATSSILLIGLLAWVVRAGPKSVFDEQGRLVQRGTVTQGVKPGSYEVVFDRPYAAPPELTWTYKPLGCKWIQKRADGFRFKIILRGAHDLAPRWMAKGIPAKPGD
ncbi:MAG: hypothetical protein ACE5GE_15540 [Phycisphaerae bacterium]